MKSTPTLTQELEKAMPVLRSVLAYGLFLRFGSMEGFSRESWVNAAYNTADLFLERFQEDLLKVDKLQAERL